MVLMRMRITNVSVVETTCLDQTQNLILVMNGPVSGLLLLRSVFNALSSDPVSFIICLAAL